MSKLARKHSSYRSTIDRSLYHSRLALSARACSAILAGTMLLGGGLAASLAYADGYVAPDGNIYYGYKSDANYSKDRIKIEVHYYSNMKDAEDDNIANQDPLGKFVHVKYIANLNSSDNSFDKWAFRPMWWYGVPAGLTDVHDINYSRFEQYTDAGAPAPSTPGIRKDSDNVTKHYANSKDWKGISNFYITDPAKLTSMNGLSTLLGIDGKRNNGYDNAGNTAGNWSEYYDATKGMQGMFIDWESAGKRFYQMTYVAELTPQAWKERDEHPLRFGAGVYRFAGNWHIATGQVHRAPKIGDSLKVVYPSLTPVAKADSLTPDEKTNVTTAIKKANENAKHFADLLEKIEVGKDGTATLTFHDKTTLTMLGNLLVVEEKKDNVKFPPVYPAPIGVVNPKNLSDADQKTIIQGFKDANKGKDFLTKVSDKDSDVYKFDNNNQTLKINYKDGSSLTIPYDQLVYQGATIADWAPYVVPAPTEVKNLSSLDATEQKQVTDAFDKANADLDVYTAAKKDGKTPVTFDKDFKNAIITWADGSQTQVPSWQFLKQKAAPAPEPSVPTPAAEKTFIVEHPETPTVVTFDPFKTTTAEITTGNVATQLNNLKSTLKAKTAKDSQNPQTKVTITDVEYSVDNNGVGYITFKANGYKDAKYPMGVFFKQNPNNKVLPQTGTTTTSNTNKQGYKYNYTKFKIQGTTPTAAEKNAAVKQFVKDNYNGTVNDCSNGTYMLNAGLTPKDGTQGLAINNTSGLSKVVADNTSIKVLDKSGTAVITINDPYEKNQGQAGGADTTLADLRALAKKLLAAKQKAGVTNKDLKKAGITDPANLSNAEKGIDKMDEKTLRDLIQKLTDVKHYDRKYNTPTLEVDNPDNLTEDNLKAAIKAFLEANYDNADTVNVTSTSDFTLPTNLTPKKGTVYMEVGADGVAKIKSASKDGIVVVDGDGTTTFTVKPTYTKKAVPSADALAQMKEDAKKLIDKNPYLTPDQKKEYKKKIEDAKDQPGIQKILDDAKTQGEKNKQNTTDPQIQQIINNNKGGGDEKKQHELDAAKEAAKKAIEALHNLSQDQKTEFENKLNGTDVKTPADVQKIVDAAKLADALESVKKDVAKLVFLDHGKGADADKTDPNHTEDAALDTILNTKPTKDATLATLETKLAATPVVLADVKNALTAATRQNGINEQAAKQAATAKLSAFEQSLEDAYNKLSDTDKTAVSTQYNAAKEAITKAKTAVTKATKPSELLQAISDINTALDTANKAISEKANAAQKDNKKDNDHDSKPDAFKQEKEHAKAEIDKIDDLTPEQKKQYKEEIDHADHKGDPEAIVNRAKKHTKIDAALKAIDEFKHLNNAQKDAFKAILKDTDASDHTNPDGTTSDDIDDVLANAANTDNAMARLEGLKIIADEFAKGEKYKGANDTLKKAFDDASTAAGAVLDKAKGADKGADEVNTLYNDLLKAMRDIDPNAKSAGLKTDALSKEIDTDKTFKPSETDPKTPGNSVYNTSSKAKKDEFDKALGAAQTVLNGAKTADISTADKEAAEQKEIDAALDKLIKARLALDGVNTDALQAEVKKDGALKDDISYKNASQAKKDAFDKALKDVQDLISQLGDLEGTGKQYANKSQKEKQALVDEALKTLKDAAAALDGVDTKALQAEVDKDAKLPEDVSYKNASKDKQSAFDTALTDAKDLVAHINADSTKTKTEKQTLVDNALKALQTAAAALDGVDTKPLQDEVHTADEVKKSDAYIYASQDKKDAYDQALQQADKLLKELSDSSTDTRTKDQKEKALADALKLVQDTKAALDGKKPESPAEHVESAQPVEQASPKTSDPFVLGQVLASLLGSAGILGAGFAGRKRSSAKHMKRKK
ncbi:GA module-containing protein [Fannyhessea vaginae]|uniref:GA module-containing protein n=1 Tax=Fannyhessea vaginae TaxID=82135 RepID=UPI0001E8EAAA|nr:GA module-containing protein [Fannyhessea vaginae]QPR41302.1 GA module-containing protein [Fannyhessea vaginae]SSZ03038.1 ECM-binding protein homolog [Fannyhessea vaginae]